MSSRGRFPVFAVTFAAVYAVVYYFAVSYNLALFSYGPAVGEWTLFTQAASAGPTMYWYGWMATSAIAGAGAGLLTCLLTENLRKRWWSDLAWLAPLASIAAFIYLLSGYFTR